MPVRTRVADGVLAITLERPAALNALDAEMLRGLRGAREAAEDPKVRVVTLQGSGRAFCSGVDIAWAADPADVPDLLRREFHPLVLGLESLRKPLVTGVTGVTAGAGIGLALLGDLRIGVPGSRFVPAFVTQGLVPDAGTTHLAVRAMGYDGAVGFLLGGSELAGEQALAQGLLTRMVPPGALEASVRTAAAHLASLPTEAVAGTLALLRSAARTTLAEQLEAEAVRQDALAVTDEVRDLRRRQRERVLGTGHRSPTTSATRRST